MQFQQFFCSDAASNGPGLLVTVGVPIGIVLIATIVCGLLIKYYRKTRVSGLLINKSNFAHIRVHLLQLT